MELELFLKKYIKNLPNSNRHFLKFGRIDVFRYHVNSVRKLRKFRKEAKMLQIFFLVNQSEIKTKNHG